MSSIELKDYKFKNTDLLKIALTHPSVANTNSRDMSYERMEFLGDSILKIIIAELIYNKFDHCLEGQLSVALANLINAKTIVLVAKKLKLSQKIILDSGEEKSGGRKKSNNLENVLEAIIAAIYLDSDFSTVKKVVSEWWKEFFQDTNKLFQKDYKSQLQELLQKKYKVLPKYKTEVKEGEAHQPIFTISVSSRNKYQCKAKGKTKKEAEQKAAKEMINFINNHSNE